MKIRTQHGPAAWASALVNGDQSSLTTDDVIAMNHWRDAWLEQGEHVVGIVDGAEPHFSRNYHLYDRRYQGGDVIEYQILGA
jgi:hypothetical protein